MSADDSPRSRRDRFLPFLKRTRRKSGAGSELYADSESAYSRPGSSKSVAHSTTQSFSSKGLASTIESPRKSSAYQTLDGRPSTSASVLQCLQIWSDAFRALDEEKRQYLVDTADPACSGPGDLLTFVQEQADDARRKQLVFHVKNREIIVRDLWENVAGTLQKFTQIGDALVQCDASGHAALPWAAVKVLFQAAVNDQDRRAAALEGLKLIPRDIFWGFVHEELYCDVPYTFQAQLVEAIRNYFSRIQVYLATVCGLLRRNTAVSFVAAFVKNGAELRDMADSIVLARRWIQDITGEVSRNDQLKSLKSLHSLERMLQDLNKPLLRIENYSSGSFDMLKQAQKEKVLNWISTVPYLMHHQQAEDKILGGTCQWIVDHNAVREWQTSSATEWLWLHGSMGTGKTTLFAALTKSLINRSAKYGEPYPVYFYCSRTTGETHRSDASSILRTVLRQLLDLPREGGNSALTAKLEDRQGADRELGPLTRDEVRQLASEAISSRRLTYILVDAVDECDHEQRSEFLRDLYQIVHNSKSLTKVLIASRDDSAIERGLKDPVEILVDSHANTSDINNFIYTEVDKRIMTGELLSEELMPIELRGHIKDVLKERAAGMFRWVQLQLHYLCQFDSPQLVRDAVRRLPTKLQDSYQLIYDTQVAKQPLANEVATKRILSWLLVSKRELKTQELINLVFRKDGTSRRKEDILSLTYGFVIHDRYLNTFRLAHLSVREFLESSIADYNRSSAHAIAAETCLDILMSDNFLRYGTLLEKAKTAAQAKSAVQSHSADGLNYAAIFWVDHVAGVTEPVARSNLIKSRVDVFLNDKSQHFRTWSNVCSGGPLLRYGQLLGSSQAQLKHLRRLVCKPADSLPIACYAGLSTTVAKLIKGRSDIANIQTGRMSLLHIAANYGHPAVVEVLLDAGVPIDFTIDERTALDWAICHESNPAISLLLNRGARPTVRTFLEAIYAPSEANIKTLADWAQADFPSYVKQGLLHAAASAGNAFAVGLFLREGEADINSYHVYGEDMVYVAGGASSTPLYNACAAGNQHTAELLLNERADANRLARIDQEHASGLALNCIGAACGGGHYGIVELLIQRGAEVSRSSGDIDLSSQALYLACLQSSPKLVHLLIDNGASPTPDCLGLAASLDDIEMMRWLLEKGVDVNARTSISRFRTALSTASARGSLEGARLLLANGADVNAPGGLFGTALGAAASQGHSAVVSFLIDVGAEVNNKEPVSGKVTCKALYAASVAGHSATVDVLVKAGAYVEGTSGTLGSSLMAACNEGHIEVVRLLLQAGADPNDHHEPEGTALQRACYQGNRAICQLLIRAGADGEAQGGRYGTALMAATSNNQMANDDLLSRGADVNLFHESPYHSDYATALQAVACTGNINLLDGFLTAGAEVNTIGGRLGTALTAACWHGNAEAVDMLLAAGANANIVAGVHGTALQAAALNGNTSVIEALLAAGADVNAAGGEYQCPLNAARFMFRQEIERILVDAGAVAKPDLERDPEVQGAPEEAAQSETTPSSVAIEEPVRPKPRRKLSQASFRVLSVYW